jgi:predicted ATP-grasp superfamily ATP-dependent carboligase
MVAESVYVADARSVAALAVVRSLGRERLVVTCGDSSRLNPTLFSRYVRKRVVYRDPSIEPEEFMDGLEAELTREKYSAFIPVRDATTRLLARYPERFARYVGFCVPDYEALATAADKGRTVKAALQHGVPVPRTFFPEEMSLQRIAADIEFPALIKPRIGSGARGIVFVRDADELTRCYPEVQRISGEAIIQEYICDDRQNIGSAFLFNLEGELRAAYAYLVLRQFPVRGGSTTYGVTANLPEVVDCGSRLLQKLGWRGVAQVNFAVDPRDGELKLIEVNPRFWTSVALGTLAGVDMPYLLYRIIADGDIEPVRGYRSGCYHRWLLPADLLWFMNVDKSWGNIKEFFRFFQPDLCYGVCSASDPLPVLGAALQAAAFVTDRSRRDFVLKRGW